MIGVDEVGRGCLAGPLLVVAARQIGQLPDGLRDSKKLSQKERERLHDLLAPPQNLSGTVGNRIAERRVFGAGLSNCCDFGEGWVKATEIDYYGLSKALKLGALRALRNLQAAVDEEIILDGSFNYIPKKFKNSRTLIGGDDIVPLISAASIHAKVTRDRFMIELAKRHPAYKFENHVGYGTKAHMLALETKGALKYVHRHSFLPIAGPGRSAVIKTTERGLKAEQAVADELARGGYEIIGRNWKTKVCEIDVVALKDGVVYFVEVKFRSGQAQGGGLEYVGPQKLHKMHFAAQIWAQSNNWDGDYRLMAASVTTDGLNYIIEEIIEI